MSFPPRLTLLLSVCALLAALIGCAPIQPTPPETPQAQEALADELLEEGDPARAAELYLNAGAAYERSEDRYRARVAAADAWLQAGDPHAATSALAPVDPSELRGRASYRYGFVRARLLLARGEPKAAENQLAALEDPPSDLQAEYYTLRANAARERGAPLEAARLRTQLAPHLANDSLREENRQAIWALLAEAQIAHLQTDTPDDSLFAGWVELARIAREHRLQPQRLEAAVDDWMQRFSAHPAAEHRAPELISRFQERIRKPARIAVLLPLSGELRDAGRSIRDGLLVAFYAGSNPRPEVTVYDTAGDPKRIDELYRRAVEDGAEQVVGPLTKESLERLIEEVDSLPVPVLALNTLEPGLTRTAELYQFSLDPEAEARQAARHAHLRGWKTVVTLSPDSPWGKRLEAAFIDAFTQLDGIVLQSALFDPQRSDFSGAIRDLLNLQASQQRYRQITRLLGQAPSYTPRRRQDVDALFLAAFPEQARKLRPQISYHYAQDLPVISTSHVYSGSEERDSDRDLNGILFLDSPWLLNVAIGVPPGLERQFLATHWGPVMQQQARLMALGIDAYRIIPYLGILESHPEERLDGLTGRLSLGEDGVIHRELVPARFVGGRPVYEPLTREGSDEAEAGTQVPPPPTNGER